MNICKIKTLYILVLILSLAGCEYMGPKLHEKMPLEVVGQTEEQDQSDIIYQELSNETAGAETDEGLKAELYPGTGEFISRTSGHGSDKASAKGAYSLNFDDADLGEVIKVVLSDILSANYVLSPKVTGKVTLQTTQPLSKAELLPTLEMLLQLNNAVLIHQNGIFQIKPKSEAMAGSAFNAYSKYKQKLPTGHQIRVVPVRNVAVSELAGIIKPLVQDKTILHVDSDRNMMLITGSEAELDRVMEMVETFDVDVMKGRSFGLFPLQNVAAVTIIQELEQVFNQNDNDFGDEFFQFMEIERLNAILAITQQPKYLNDIEQWVLRLDKSNTSAGGGVTVYKVQHADAIELAETLNEIFSQGGQSRRPASVAAGRETVKITNKQKKTETIKRRRTSSQPSVGDVGEVNIIADEENNSLVIVATAQDYAVIYNVIKQLDVMPLQVLIDATIVDVQLTDELEYGIKWFLQSGKHAVASKGNGINLLEKAGEIAAGVSSGGLSYAFISSDFKAVLEAEAAKGKVNIISSPSVMVLNNQEANFQVAEERSLLASESTNLAGGVSNVVTNTVEQRKAGVNVTVKPRVNANGLVIMDITQLVENFLPSEENGNPNILTREVTSSIAVQSGETIVLAGLINEVSQHEKSGIPLLYDLPFIGPLFGSTSITKAKTELVLLITPRVVKSRHDARLVTNEFKRKLSGIYYDEQVEMIQE